MSNNNQNNEIDKGLKIKADLQEGDITMKIKKNKKQPKNEEVAQLPFLDDHVESYGKDLMASIANLIEKSKTEKPKRNKKQMTPEMIEKCRQNLQKGRETILKNRQAKLNTKDNNQPIVQPIVQQPIVQQPKPIPIQQPIVQQPIVQQPKPIPIQQPVQQPVQQYIQQPIKKPMQRETVRLKYGESIF